MSATDCEKIVHPKEYWYLENMQKCQNAAIIK